MGYQLDFLKMLIATEILFGEKMLLLPWRHSLAFLKSLAMFGSWQDVSVAVARLFGVPRDAVDMVTFGGWQDPSVALERLFQAHQDGVVMVMFLEVVKRFCCHGDVWKLPSPRKWLKILMFNIAALA